MRSLQLSILFLLLTLASCAQSLSPKQIFDLDSKYVFSIEVWDKTGPRISASAVAAMPFVEAAGDDLATDLARMRSGRVATDVLVTNAHVVSTADFALGSPPFKLRHGEKTFYGTTVNIDLKRDLLWIKFEGLAAERAAIRSFSSLSVGERVYSIGSPLGLENTLSEGLVSGLRMDGDLPIIQTTASISHGSSGGGLFDSNGRLVGITTYSLKDTQNLNFAIPADALGEFETYQDRLIDKATAASDRRDSSARNLCLDALTVASDNHRKSLAWGCLSYFWLKSDDTASAEGAAASALKEDPNFFAPHYLSAMIFEKEQKFSQALAEYRKAARLEPKDERFQAGIARCRSVLKTK